MKTPVRSTLSPKGERATHRMEREPLIPTLNPSRLQKKIICHAERSICSIALKTSKCRSFASLRMTALGLLAFPLASPTAYLPTCRSAYLPTANLPASCPSATDTCS